MENLFTNLYNDIKPLAERMRPTGLDDFVGQRHILGEGKLLRRLIEAKRVPSCIFYGPPGTGKTTLARIIAETTGGSFVMMNAISSGVAEVKVVIEEAKKNFEMYGKRTYLLLDECHRWSKAQSDTLLSVLESGQILLIGATTEAPQYNMTRAIVSRCSLFEFKPVETEDIKRALRRAIGAENGLKAYRIQIDGEALTYFATACAGDVRSALNGLEIGVLTTNPNKDGEIVITKEIAAECLQKKALSLNEDVFYHILSAFCKSLRGSDATAALYYANRLIEAGCEPQLLARRTIVHASEDCCSAKALNTACNALYALNNLGMPEGNIVLTQAIIEVCEARKTNRVIKALGMAMDDARNHPDDNIPAYLKNHTEASKKYKYPHDYGGWVEQQYLPDSLKDRDYFKDEKNG
ncbi:MAG TPA: replication-associated recombination protein A [Candidatus Borkfalkia excrementigallinarum]|uniref:Replication-associated recombination protein A n=1 Tax=Candidatus Borkfalkia excrementigallinarum TaxID=2838506 RepID=A0A9D2CSS3_9FIRM|nr:replication-associated recombination protein A [Candidatus Borkfalkia excrementigallinarum]